MPETDWNNGADAFLLNTFGGPACDRLADDIVELAKGLTRVQVSGKLPGGRERQHWLPGATRRSIHKESGLDAGGPFVDIKAGRLQGNIRGLGQPGRIGGTGAYGGSRRPDHSIYEATEAQRGRTV